MLPIHGEPSTQILMPTWRSTSSPLSGSCLCYLRVRDLIWPQPHGERIAHLLDDGPEHRVERHFRAGGQPAAVEPASSARNIAG